MTEEKPSDDSVDWWDQQYADLDTLPWDTGNPQPAISSRYESGDIVGRVLDVGCGIGTESLYIAEQGHTVTGIDFSEKAIDRARTRAADRPLDGNVRFETGDAFLLPEMDIGPFDTVIDCGMLHTLDADDRRGYTGSLAAVLATGGRAVCVEFGEDARDDWGPVPLSHADIRDSFDDRWSVATLDDCVFATRQGTVPGVVAVARLTS